MPRRTTTPGERYAVAASSPAGSLRPFENQAFDGQALFIVPLTMVDGSNKLLDFFEMYKIRQSRLRRILSRLTPQLDPANPLQMIIQDYSDAEDDFESVRKSSQSDVPKLTPLQEQSTVSDYVRFIVEYDTMCRQIDRLRVTSVLG